MKLTEKQKRFVDYYIETGNATEAARKAGYSEKTARSVGAENLTKPDIRKAIDEALQQLQSERIADAKEVMEYLTAVMRREYKECVVVTTSEEVSTYVPDETGKMRKQTVRKETPQVVEIPARLADANKAAELIGKRYGLFTDKIDIEGPVTIRFEDEYASPDPDD